VHPIYIVKKLMKIDLLLVSGGGQLDEFWGGAWAHPYTLFKWAALSRLTRTKVAFLSVGAGTVSSPVSQWFLRQALRMSNYRSYRDTGSKEIVRDCLKFDRNDPVVPDMAYAYPVSTPITASSHNTGRLIVAVGLMPYCHPKVWPIRNSAAYERYVSVLTEFCRQLMLKDITLRFFVGQTRHDPPVIQEVIEKLLSQYQDRVKLQVEVPHMNTVEDLITCLSDADIVVASRYHGVLLASLLRRPILSLSYERKVRKLMTDLDLGEFCLDIEQADTENLAVMFTKIEARRKSISIELDSRVRHETNAVLAQFDRIVATLLP
jgi:polysaccharide pyruvyl transferase WcaK-like protein